AAWGRKSFRNAVTPGIPREQAGEGENETHETRPKTLHCSKGDSDATLHHATDGGGPGLESDGCGSGRWRQERGRLQVLQPEQQELQQQQQQLQELLFFEVGQVLQQERFLLVALLLLQQVWLQLLLLRQLL